MIDPLDQSLSRGRLTKSLTSPPTETLNKERLASVAPSANLARVDTALKVVNNATRGGVAISKSAVHRATNVVRHDETINQERLKARRLDIRAAAVPATDKVDRVAKQATDRVSRRIVDDPTKTKQTISTEDIRRDRLKLKAVPPATVVRRGAFQTIRPTSRSKPNRPTMTSAVDVVGWSLRTRRSRHSLVVRHREHLARREAVARRLREHVRHVGVMLRTMPVRSRNRRADIPLSVDRLAARAVTVKRGIANCPLAAEADGQGPLHHRNDR